MKHTHIGYCQACGALQAVAVSGGLIAQHGYKRDRGFFEGVCPGSKYLPAQASVDLTHQIIASCRAMAIAAWKRSAELETAVFTHHTYYRRDRNSKLEVERVVEWSAIPAWEQKQLRDRMVRAQKDVGDRNRDHADFLTSVVLEKHGLPLLPAPVIAEPLEIKPGMQIGHLTVVNASRFGRGYWNALNANGKECRVTTRMLRSIASGE